MKISRLKYPLAPLPALGQAEVHVWEWQGDRATCRARMQELLRGYLGSEPPSFTIGPEGKPSVPGIEFNLTHTADEALFAVSRETAVGIDLERTARDSRLELISERFFQPAEIAWMKGAKDPAALFFRLWTAKEALIKAMGTGAFRSLHSLEVAERGGKLVVARVPAEYGSPADWELVELQARSGLAACLAFKR
ncbi:MAG TPA: 4'-phosphopantetheinyl transferase superfamily protein [Bdellovibrionota bacterium]|nr:4'-phosphopantetheinyl transferase superfamily protein [Bdellovibrionota bacterium]